MYKQYKFINLSMLSDKGQGRPCPGLYWPFWPGPGPGPEKLGKGRPRPTCGHFSCNSRSQPLSALSS